MRFLLRMSLFLAGTVVLVLLAAFCWLYFYSRDLPDVGALAQYAPDKVRQVSDPCLGESVAIPYESIGDKIRNATNAAETSENDPGVLRTFFGDLVNENPRRRTVTSSWYISRSMFCTPSKMLNRRFAEMREAIQIERHYSRTQLFTIYANRVPLGPNVTGVHDGTEFYFHKTPGELDLTEAALLVGLIRGPSWLSPMKHPDRALRRRNEVIDAMLENGSITAAEAQAARAAPLGVVTVN